MEGVRPEWFGEPAGRWGLGGVALLMFLDGACLPVPSEPVLALAGLLAARRGQGLAGVVLVANLAFLAGAAAAYAAGRAGGRALALRWGPAVGLSPAALDRAEHWFRRWGDVAVFAARLVPGLRTLVSIPAGALGMPPGRFLWLTFLGALPWSFGFTYAGYVLGDRWRAFELPWGHLLGGGLALLALAAGIRRLVRRRPLRPAGPRPGR